VRRGERSSAVFPVNLTMLFSCLHRPEAREAEDLEDLEPGGEWTKTFRGARRWTTRGVEDLAWRWEGNFISTRLYMAGGHGNITSLEGPG
jgi:hypothetical protein